MNIKEKKDVLIVDDSPFALEMVADIVRELGHVPSKATDGENALRMADHRKHLSAPVLIGIGAAFDFLAGVKPQAPRWVQRSGLEWSFRLLTEPRRLWRRYLTTIPAFLVLFLLQILRLKKFPIDGGVNDSHAPNPQQHR